MIQQILSLLYFVVFLCVSTLCADVEALFAQSGSEDASISDLLKKDDEPSNIFGIRTIQIPQEGLDDRERAALVELKTLVDSMIDSSNINDFLESQNAFSKSLFGRTGKYDALSFFSNSYYQEFNVPKGISSIVLYHPYGQAIVKRCVFNDAKILKDEEGPGTLLIDGRQVSWNFDALKRRAISEEREFIFYEMLIVHGFEPLPEQLSDEKVEQYRKGDIISISVLRYSPIEETVFYFHPNGMLYGLCHKKGDGYIDSEEVSPNLYPYLKPLDMVDHFSKWESNGKVFKDYKIENTVQFPTIINTGKF